MHCGFTLLSRQASYAYLDYPEEMPLYPSQEELADFMESYANSHNLQVMTASMVQHAVFDSTMKLWTVVVKASNGSFQVLHTPQIVLATGINGLKPVMPAIKDQVRHRASLSP